MAAALAVVGRGRWSGVGRRVLAPVDASSF